MRQRVAYTVVLIGGIVVILRELATLSTLPGDIKALVDSSVMPWIGFAAIAVGAGGLVAPAMQRRLSDLRLVGKRSSRSRASRKSVPSAVPLPESKPVPWAWSRRDWTRVLTETGVTEAVYRRLNPQAHPLSLYEDHHERRVIENKLLDDFLLAHKGALKGKRDALAKLTSWARKRAYEEMRKRKERDQ